jgi:carbonic anhydrase/acetyltransferase-like protein (isoleucine patch superfamily)
MLVNHRGSSPAIDPTAVVAPTAVISGDVHIAAGVCVLAGAVITSEGAPVTVGEGSIVMEHAVLRGAGAHPCVIGSYVIIGPHTHVTGATIGGSSFIATGAAIFNAATIGEESLVAVNGIVHIATTLPPRSIVPMGHVAVGEPAQVYAPHEAPAALVHVGSLGFTRIVFGFDSGAMSNGEATRALCERYARALRRHADDEVV